MVAVHSSLYFWSNLGVFVWIFIAKGFRSLRFGQLISFHCLVSSAGQGLVFILILSFAVDFVRVPPVEASDLLLVFISAPNKSPAQFSARHSSGVRRPRLFSSPLPGLLRILSLPSASVGILVSTARDLGRHCCFLCLAAIDEDSVLPPLKNVFFSPFLSPAGPNLGGRCVSVPQSVGFCSPLGFSV
jgi:hypothetical protein